MVDRYTWPVEGAEPLKLDPIGPYVHVDDYLLLESKLEYEYQRYCGCERDRTELSRKLGPLLKLADDVARMPPGCDCETCHKERNGLRDRAQSLLELAK